MRQILEIISALKGLDHEVDLSVVRSRSSMTMLCAVLTLQFVHIPYSLSPTRTPLFVAFMSILPRDTDYSRCCSPSAPQCVYYVVEIDHLLNMCSAAVRVSPISRLRARLSASCRAPRFSSQQPAQAVLHASCDQSMLQSIVVFFGCFSRLYYKQHNSILCPD